MSATHAAGRPPVPPRWLITVVNPITKTILRSPFHGLLSRKLVLITFTGRTTGRVYTTPALYVQAGDTLRLRAGYPWWKNLRGGAAVRVRLRGKAQAATADVLGEEDGLTVVDVRLHG